MRNNRTRQTESKGGERDACASASPSPSSLASAADRRRFPRIPHRAAFHVRPLLNDGVGVPIEVVLQDLSAAGMGVIHSQAMRVGDQYQVPLTREGAAEPLSLVCTVVRCERMDDELFSIGFEFNSPAAAVDEGSRQLTGQPARRD
jgi:hypothetical protein